MRTTIAFSSEVDTGLRQENEPKQSSRASLSIPPEAKIPRLIVEDPDTEAIVWNQSVRSAITGWSLAA
jgi:hypothetical protein